MSNANEEKSTVPRSSNVRQLIRMFEQLTICSGDAVAPFTVRAENVVEKPAKKVAKVLMLLINGRRVAQTITYKRKTSGQVMEVD
ncbi:hypothetical protein ACLKA7_007321 [Drosophila subpalustris]